MNKHLKTSSDVPSSTVSLRAGGSRETACPSIDATSAAARSELNMDDADDYNGCEQELMPRSPADDERIAMHEIGGHALVSVLLGSPLGGVSCEPADSDGYSGLCWGPEFRTRFAGGDDAPTLCKNIGPLMPAPGEPRAGVADIFLHVHTRVVELVAGSVAEALFLPGKPWNAIDDRRQERAYAALICTGPESVEAFIKFCMVEAAALLRPLEHIARVLAAELLVKRTMTGAEVNEAISAAAIAKSTKDENQRRENWRRRQESACAFTARWDLS